LYDLLNVDIKFADNSTEVNTKYMGRLAEATTLLKEHKSLALVVTGHADASGTEEYNDNLALGRAKQVER
ncbi:OmpA family protein, partial [Vibrio echinoideorum]